jgi:NADPH-dependent 2,4-dienoyl-CoA reductase/sulfur reductase-like enzyme
MVSSTQPVLVVGAGPVGLVAAAELARRGAPVRIIDKLIGLIGPIPRMSIPRITDAVRVRRPVGMAR